MPFSQRLSRRYGCVSGHVKHDRRIELRVATRTVALPAAASTPRADRYDRTDHRDCADNNDPADGQLPTESTDRAEPTLPIDPNEPTDPSAPGAAVRVVSGGLPRGLNPSLGRNDFRVDRTAQWGSL
jgi:hypothetical protein